MSVQKNEIYDLLKRLEIILEKSFSILPNYLVAVKLKEIEQIIDSIYGALPKEVQEARRLLRRKEELQIDAEQKANKIINDANTEAARLLSEDELTKVKPNRLITDLAELDDILKEDHAWSYNMR